MSFFIAGDCTLFSLSLYHGKHIPIWICVCVHMLDCWSLIFAFFLMFSWCLIRFLTVLFESKNYIRSVIVYSQTLYTVTDCNTMPATRWLLGIDEIDVNILSYTLLSYTLFSSTLPNNLYTMAIRKRLQQVPLHWKLTARLMRNRSFGQL